MSVAGIILAILFFCILIIGHEFGHFITAKILGVKVLEFSLGMGPSLWHKQGKETLYSVRAVPLGGYCKLEGEDGSEDKTDLRSFSNQPAWSKILILIMGSAMNIIMGILICFFVFLSAGYLSTTIDTVAPEQPAAVAGILPGDRIVSVNNVEYDSWTEILTAISGAEPGADLSVGVERQNQESKKEELIVIQVVPVYSEEYQRSMIGITSRIEHSVGKSLKSALTMPAEMYQAIKSFFHNLFVGKVSSDDVVGVVGIIAVAGEQAQSGLINVVYLMGVISLNLAFMNMLPFPALDGGRVLFVLIRAISKGKVGDKAEAIVNTIGFIILIVLMIFIMFKDTIRLFH